LIRGAGEGAARREGNSELGSARGLSASSDSRERSLIPTFSISPSKTGVNALMARGEKESERPCVPNRGF
jgi:hypothetical protein